MILEKYFRPLSFSLCLLFWSIDARTRAHNMERLGRLCDRFSTGSLRPSAKFRGIQD